MLTSEVLHHLTATAPWVMAELNRLTPERRAAHFDAIQAIYQGRSGDALFSGLDRHEQLASYVGSEDGWARVERLARHLFRHGTWGKVEAERLAKALAEKLDQTRKALTEANEREYRARTLHSRCNDRVRDLRRELAEAECGRAAQVSAIQAAEQEVGTLQIELNRITS